VTVSRRDHGGAAYLRLQKLAKAQRRPTQELLHLFVLEAFLDRLSQSSFRRTFVLKGGVLMAGFGHRRTTRDIDLHARSVDNDTDFVHELVCTIADIPLDDGIVFDTSRSQSTPIRSDEWYTGVRVTLGARLATSAIDFHVDVSVGDPILPGPVITVLPRILDGHLSLMTYPLEMVCAEKIVTALSRGTANSRLRDFVDVVALTETKAFDGAALSLAVGGVMTHRNVVARPLSEVLDGYADHRQRDWSAWRGRMFGESTFPEQFAELVELFVSFADPVILGQVNERTWSPITGEWT
jgi:hypothetical protein